jgi:hypothetical protein
VTFVVMRPSNIRCQQSEQGVELAILGEITTYTAQDIISALAFFKDQPVIMPCVEHPCLPSRHLYRPSVAAGYHPKRASCTGLST